MVAGVKLRIGVEAIIGVEATKGIDKDGMGQKTKRVGEGEMEEETPKGPG